MRRRSLLQSGLFLLAACATGVAGDRLVANRIEVPAGAVALDRLAGDRIGPWQRVPTRLRAVDTTVDDGTGRRDQPYDVTLVHDYRGPDGTVVTLVLAYRRALVQEGKIHRPEVCYVAQGYVLSGRHERRLAADRGVAAIAFLGSGTQRDEQVLYWIRIGDAVTNSATGMRLTLFGQALRGRVPDGLLVRAAIATAPGAGKRDSALHEAQLSGFLADLLAAQSGPGRAVLTGS